MSLEDEPYLRLNNKFNALFRSLKCAPVCDIPMCQTSEIPMAAYDRRCLQYRVINVSYIMIVRLVFETYSELQTANIDMSFFLFYWTVRT